ncbi:transposase [Ralstonia solanacearum]|nr:transposase [Ralstonia solanacearum]
MLASHLTYLLEAQQPADLSRLAEHLPYEWIERAVTATGTASIRRRRLPAEQVVWLVIALAMYRHWSISEVVDSLDLALPNESAAFVSKSAITQARERIGRHRWRGCSSGRRKHGRCRMELVMRSRA